MANPTMLWHRVVHTRVGMGENLATVLPASPIALHEGATDLQLIPYGCTRLRAAYGTGNGVRLALLDGAGA